jgi:hypothetical protein
MASYKEEAELISLKINFSKLSWWETKELISRFETINFQHKLSNEDLKLALEINDKFLSKIFIFCWEWKKLDQVYDEILTIYRDLEGRENLTNIKIVRKLKKSHYPR